MSDSISSSPQFGAGELLDGWLIEATLGSGGMGVVYRAVHTESGVLAALKVLAGPAARDFEMVRRFRREVKTLARLRHPAVVNILQEALEHTPPYFALELVEGGTLLSRIEQAFVATGRGLAAESLTRLTLELAEGLEAVHAQQIVHRDIKPQNVLFGPNDQAKLADFGMARALDLTNLTMDGRVMGTLPYMAPEMLRAEPVDPRADLYQLGITLYEAATGRRPYTGEILVGVLGGRLLPPLPRIVEHHPEAPHWLQPLCDRLAAHAPADRFQSAALVLEYVRRESARPRRGRTPAGVSGEQSAIQRTSVPPLAPPRPSRPNPVQPEPASLEAWLKGLPGGGLPGGGLPGGAMAAAVFATAGILLLAIVLASRPAPEPPAPEPPQSVGLSDAPATEHPSPAAAGRSRPLPGCPVFVELPDTYAAFGQGEPPAFPATPGGGRPAPPRPTFPEPGLWQVLVSHPPAAVMSKPADAMPGLPDPRLLRLGSVETDRFGEELTVLEGSAYAGAYYPTIRGSVARRLGLGRGRLSISEIPTATQLASLVGNCQGPPWLELMFFSPRLLPAEPDFLRKLSATCILLGPCLSSLRVGRNFRTGDWAGKPTTLLDFVTKVRAGLADTSAGVVVDPEPLLHEGPGLDPDPRVAFKHPAYGRAMRLELRVGDPSGRWDEALASCKHQAQLAGLGRLPWDVCLNRMPRSSPRANLPRPLLSGSTVEMRELMRASVKAIAGGVDRIWFSELRQTAQGPIFIDVLSSGLQGKIIETDGGGARPFRYLLSRLASARPSRMPLPAGVQGAALDLPDRRVWFLWAPDGTRREVKLSTECPAVLTVRVCPVTAWTGNAESALAIQTSSQGMVAVEVDDGLLAIEELPL